MRVARDIESGEASGVAGTPTFFINGRRHEGAAELGTLAEAIDAARTVVRAAMSEAEARRAGSITSR